MPSKIIIVRHGETDYNKSRRIQGWLDIPLNDLGHSQAKTAADLLKNHHVDAIYSSDLTRAHETAKHLAEALDMEIKLSPALRERDMGVFTGWAFESEPDPIKEQLWIEFEQARDSHQLEWNKHQGESIGDMADRIAKFFDDLQHHHQEQTVLVVTHGGAINRILEHFGLKDTGEGFRPVKNASILILHKETTTYRLEEL